MHGADVADNGCPDALTVYPVSPEIAVAPFMDNHPVLVAGDTFRIRRVERSNDDIISRVTDEVAQAAALLKIEDYIVQFIRTVARKIIYLTGQEYIIKCGIIRELNDKYRLCGVLAAPYIGGDKLSLPVNYIYPITLKER